MNTVLKKTPKISYNTENYGTKSATTSLRMIDLNSQLILSSYCCSQTQIWSLWCFQSVHLLSLFIWQARAAFRWWCM